MSSNKGEITIQEPTRAQRTIARRAAESRATVPHLELSGEVELPEAGDLLPRLVRACALGLRAVPRANGSYRDGRFELYSRVNVGVITETEDAYAIPTVFDADRKSLGELGAELGDLRSRAQSGELAPPELSGATFTLWLTAAAAAAPLVVPPQAAALAAGQPRPAPIIRNGEVVAGTLLTVTLSCDHRILYGTHAAELLAAISFRLEEANQ
jgi:pyruvate dehydrogenase E2 component (dihydrolipoamide acetyltransferase)